jgi:hypothetical protein
MRDSDTCALCAQEVETLDHLLLGCVHSRETWFRVLRYYLLRPRSPDTAGGAAILRLVVRC